MRPVVSAASHEHQLSTALVLTTLLFREWFTMLDTFVRATLNLARTGALLARLKAPAWPYSQECSTAKKCKEYMKANPEREKPGHCTCLELKGTKTSHNLALS